jgi:hypothetical protein
MLLPLLLLLVEDQPSYDAMMASLRAKTGVAIPCRATKNPDEITVCANRKADQWRVPLVTASAGAEDPNLRVAKLLDTAPPPCGEGAFLHDCGMVGVTVSVGAKGVRVVQRPLAP